MMAARRFAEGTTVAVEKTRAELERLLANAGAEQCGTFQDHKLGKAVVMFTMSGRQIKLEIKLPAAPQPSKRTDPRRRSEQLAREAWRRLLLIVKAKLELVRDGGSTVEREFLADIVLPDGRTVIENLAPQLAETYATGRMPPLLPGVT